MLTNHGCRFTKVNKISLIKFIKKNISKTDVIKLNPVVNSKLKYNPAKQPKEFEKEYLDDHWLSAYLDKISIWYRAPFRLGIWSTDKDTEFGRFSWNSNGALNNTLSKILERTKKLQTKTIMKFCINFFEHRNSININRAEEPPKISPNSIFIYRDVTNTHIKRKTYERLGLFMLVTMAWNIPTFIMYTYILGYFSILTKNFFSASCMAIRMDLIPETEQVHIVKLGFFGIPKSILVNIKNLNRINFEEDTLCIK
jgi:hypothetical protein